MDACENTCSHIPPGDKTCARTDKRSLPRPNTEQIFGERMSASYNIHYVNLCWTYATRQGCRHTNVWQRHVRTSVPFVCLPSVHRMVRIDYVYMPYGTVGLRAHVWCVWERSFVSIDAATTVTPWVCGVPFSVNRLSDRIRTTLRHTFTRTLLRSLSHSNRSPYSFPFRFPIRTLFRFTIANYRIPTLPPSTSFLLSFSFPFLHYMLFKSFSFSECFPLFKRFYNRIPFAWSALNGKTLFK